MPIRAPESTVSAIAPQTLKMVNFQETVMQWNGQPLTEEAVAPHLVGLEENEAARKIRLAIESVIKLRAANPKDWELCHQLTSVRPSTDTVSIDTLPVGFRVVYNDTRDWMHYKKSSTPLLDRNPERYLHFRQAPGKQFFIAVNRRVGKSAENIAKNSRGDIRRALNFVTGNMTFEEMNLPPEIQKEFNRSKAIDHLKNEVLRRLKDELSARMTGGRFDLKKGEFLDLYHIPEHLGTALNRCNMGSMDVYKIKEEILEAVDIEGTTQSSYQAFNLLLQKGHSSEWASSYLCAPEHFMADWSALAQACPGKDALNPKAGLWQRAKAFLKRPLWQRNQMA